MGRPGSDTLCKRTALCRQAVETHLYSSHRVRVTRQNVLVWLMGGGGGGGAGDGGGG